MYKEGNYDDARKLFTTALTTSGYQPELAYNIALCFYQVKQYGPALKHVAEIIERGVTEHPELSVGAAADGAEVRSVGNSQASSHPQRSAVSIIDPAAQKPRLLLDTEAPVMMPDGIDFSVLAFFQVPRPSRMI